MTVGHGDAEVPVGRALGYGPTALATPANALTMARLLAAPLLVVILFNNATSWLTWGAWTLLAGTDGIDGWLARRQGTTRSGAFLDPLADKILVLGAMFALVDLHRLFWVPVIIITVRELGIIVYRVTAARQGVSVPARALAKVKTLLQALAVGAVVWPLTGHHPVMASITLWVAATLTVVTGVQYMQAARKRAAAVAAGVAGAGGGLGGQAAAQIDPIDPSLGGAAG